jgi:pimeloyl-ACP methyl ester carboxylesterase
MFKQALLGIGIVTVLAGISGVIGHTASFDSQKNPIKNTFVSAWYAGCFAVQGLNILYLLRKPNYYVSKKVYRLFEISFIAWNILFWGISLVCLALAGDWQAFAWALVCALPLSASTSYLMNYQSYGRIHAEQNNSPVPLWFRVLAVFATTLKVVTVFVTGLLCAGAIQAAIAASYKGPGKSISVLFDGANQNASLHVYCVGTTQTAIPTTFIVSSSAHGIVDFYGLQYYLNSLSTSDRRICTLDLLGFGWSDDAMEGQFQNYAYLERLMASSGEPRPWNVIGWGGGGSALAYLANNHTASIKSVTFVEVYSPDIEFEYYGYQQNLLPSQIAKYKQDQLLLRASLAKLILYMAIPWGLVSIFFPINPIDPTFYPPDKWAEFRVQLWKSKSWVSQWQAIMEMSTKSSSNDPLVAYAPLPSSVAVLGVLCNSSSTCYDEFSGKNLTGTRCTDNMAQKEYQNNRKFAMINSLNSNASLVVNSDYTCSLSLPVKYPRYTASSILSLFSQINA